MASSQSREQLNQITKPQPINKYSTAGQSTGVNESRSNEAAGDSEGTQISTNCFQSNQKKNPEEPKLSPKLFSMIFDLYFHLVNNSDEVTSTSFFTPATRPPFPRFRDHKRTSTWLYHSSPAKCLWCVPGAGWLPENNLINERLLKMQIDRTRGASFRDRCPTMKESMSCTRQILRKSRPTLKP